MRSGLSITEIGVIFCRCLPRALCGIGMLHDNGRMIVTLCCFTHSIAEFLFGQERFDVLHAVALRTIKKEP